MQIRKMWIFLHDDRAPHGVNIVCRRWYEKELGKHLFTNKVYEHLQRGWGSLQDDTKAHLQTLGFPMGQVIPYTCGVWKPNKQAFRFILGLPQSDEGRPKVLLAH